MTAHHQRWIQPQKQRQTTIVTQSPSNKQQESQCIELRQTAQSELLAATHLYAKQRSAKLLKTYDPAYVQEFNRQSNKNTAQRLTYRDSQCNFEVLDDSMSMQYAPAIIASCQLNMTQERIKYLKQKTSHSPV
jgi:uncharacterized protein YecT (DUF1311 family)